MSKVQRGLELTEKQKKEGERRYWKLVDETKKEEEHAFRTVLMSHWLRGQRVATLLKDPKKYGSRTAENFGCDIRPGRPYRGDEVRRWHRFFQVYTLDQVEKAISQRVPWRAIHSLLAEPSGKRRAELQLKVSSGEISSDDVKAIVKKDNLAKREKSVSSGGTPGRGGVVSSVVYRTFLGYITDFGAKLDEFTEACRKHDKEPSSLNTEKADNRRKECVTALTAIAPKFNRASKIGGSTPKKKPK